MNFENIIHIVVFLFAVLTSCRAFEKNGQIDLSETPKFDHEINYTWTVDRWDSRRTLGEVLFSPKFTADTYKQFKWFLSLAFHENDAIDAFLNADAENPAKTIDAKFSIFFLNRRGEIGHGLNTRHVFRIGPAMSNPLSDSWGWVNFVFHTDDFANEFVSDDTLTVLLKLEFTVEDDQTFSAEDNRGVDSISLQLNSSQIDDRNSQMLVDLLLRNHGCADVIMVANNKEYPVHKVILASRSTVLADVMETTKPTKKGDPIHIDMGNHSVEVVVQVLKFLYLGKCVPSVETATGVLEIATKFKIDGLKNDTTEALSKAITPQNAVKIFEIATKSNQGPLQAEVIEHVLSTSVKNPKVLCEVCAVDECRTTKSTQEVYP